MSKTARKTTTGKTTTAPPGAVKTSVTFDAETYKLIRLAMIETGLEMSELVNLLVKERFGGWTVRKGRGSSAPGRALNDIAPLDDPPGPASTALDPLDSAPLSVPVPLINRFSEIDRKAHYPLDIAIDQSA